MQKTDWRIFAVMLSHQTFIMMDWWMARNARPDTMRTLRRRLVGVLVVGVYILMWHYWIPAEAPYALYPLRPTLSPSAAASSTVLSLLIPGTLLMVSLQAMLEEPESGEMSREIRANHGRSRRWFGWMLSPGWPSGVCFAFLLAVSFGLLLGWRDYGIWKAYQLKNQGPVALGTTHLMALERASPSHWAAMSCLLISPLVLWQGFLRKKLHWSPMVYGLLFLASWVLLLSFLVLVRFSGNQALAKWMLPFPGMYWLWPEFQRARGMARFGESVFSRVDWSLSHIMVLTGIVWLFWWLAGLGFAFRALLSAGVLGRKAEETRPDKESIP
jgi:hypothetical protein